MALQEPVYQLFQLGDLFGGSFFSLPLAFQLAGCGGDLSSLHYRLAGARPAIALRPLPRHPRPPLSFIHRPLPRFQA
jgi:hypothetical protein